MDTNQFDNYSQRIETMLDKRLPPTVNQPGRLHEAMRYTVLAGGKRIRARLVYATGDVLGAPAARLDAIACAVEFIHAYSLIHDDLPAMDDDRLRRGLPTAHIAFDEATAILAGDALQALAFEVIATDGGLDDCPAARAAIMGRLAKACGSQGMVGGQALDMASQGHAIDLADLERLHRLKTGALLRACVMMAADACDPLAAEARAALDDFAVNIGLAFQVRDDVLDIEATTEALGKTSGADIAHAKATYPALLGLEPAKAHADRLYTQALDALGHFGDAAAPLRAIAGEIVARDR